MLENGLLTHALSLIIIYGYVSDKFSNINDLESAYLIY